jgi:hypothetical protein
LHLSPSEKRTSKAAYSSDAARMMFVGGNAHESCSSCVQFLQMLPNSSCVYTSSSSSLSPVLAWTLSSRKVRAWRVIPTARGRVFAKQMSTVRTLSPETRQRNPSRALKASFSALSSCLNSSVSRRPGNFPPLLSSANSESAPEQPNTRKHLIVLKSTNRQ